MRLSISIAVCVAVIMASFELTFSKENVPPLAHPEDVIAVKVYNVVEVADGAPVVLLSDLDEKMAFPIWISPFEANAIYMELGKIKPFRPQTHELIKRLIESFNGNMSRIVITHEAENVFYAKLVLEKDGGTTEVDARPSDSIVLALKFNAPILVDKNLFVKRAIAIGGENENIQNYGLTLQELSLALAQYFSLGSLSGVMVSDVRKESKAETDGFKIRDIIVEIDAELVKGIDTIRNALSKGPTEAKVKIFRDNDFIFLTLHLKAD